MLVTPPPEPTVLWPRGPRFGAAHVPTLPPRGPAAVRHLGVALVLGCLVVVVAVLALALTLPRPSLNPRAPTIATTATTTTMEVPLVETLPESSDDRAVALRDKLSRTLARRGFRSGDLPDVEALVIKSTAFEKRGRVDRAIALLKRAQREAERQEVDRGFIFAKQKRLAMAVEQLGTVDSRRFDEVFAEVQRHFATLQYERANNALNKAFALLNG